MPAPRQWRPSQRQASRATTRPSDGERRSPPAPAPPPAIHPPGSIAAAAPRRAPSENDRRDFRQTRSDDAAQLRRERRSEIGRQQWIVAENRSDETGLSLSLKRRSARDHLEEHRAERE